MIESMHFRLCVVVPCSCVAALRAVAVVAHGKHAPLHDSALQTVPGSKGW